MQKNIETKVHEAYDKLIEYPLKVQEIFNDFYGEDKVDLQGLPTYEEFKEFLEVTRIGRIIPNWSFIKSLITEKDKDIVKTLKEEGVEDYHFTDSIALATYLLPPCVKAIRSFFGNEIFILVHFPLVRVTNENDKYVDIQDLYAKVPITLNGNGTGAFFLNRSTYPVSHIRYGYLHSHCPQLRLSDMGFKNVCMGKGPIKATITSLISGFDDGLWQLFCLELDKFTKTESLTGGPYIKLEGIGKNANEESMMKMYFDDDGVPQYVFKNSPGFSHEDFVRFVKWVIKSKVLKFNLCSTGFALAHTYYDVMLKLSNEFLKYWNTRLTAGTTDVSIETLRRNGILTKCLVRDGKLYRFINSRTDYSSYEGRFLFIFKEKAVTFHILHENEGDEVNNEVLWLSSGMAQSVLKIILEILNYNYGRDKGGGAASAPYERKFYF